MNNHKYNPFHSHYYAQRYFHHGEIYYGKGDIDKAREEFKKYLELLPEHKKAKEYINKITQG